MPRCREPGCHYPVGPTGADGCCHGHYVRHERPTGLTGPLIPQVTLAEVERDEARRTYAAGGVTIAALAVRYGIGRSTMQRIIAGKDRGR